MEAVEDFNLLRFPQWVSLIHAPGGHRVASVLVFEHVSSGLVSLVPSFDARDLALEPPDRLLSLSGRNRRLDARGIADVWDAMEIAHVVRTEFGRRVAFAWSCEEDCSARFVLDELLASTERDALEQPLPVTPVDVRVLREASAGSSMLQALRGGPVWLQMLTRQAGRRLEEELVVVARGTPRALSEASVDEIHELFYGGEDPPPGVVEGPVWHEDGRRGVVGFIRRLEVGPVLA